MNGTAAAPTTPLFWIISDRMVGSQMLEVQIASSEPSPNSSPTIVLWRCSGREKLQGNEAHELAVVVRRALSGGNRLAAFPHRVRNGRAPSCGGA